jgi:hypothetical protein
VLGACTRHIESDETCRHASTLHDNFDLWRCEHTLGRIHHAPSVSNVVVREVFGFQTLSTAFMAAPARRLEITDHGPDSGAPSELAVDLGRVSWRFPMVGHKHRDLEGCRLRQGLLDRSRGAGRYRLPIGDRREVPDQEGASSQM